MKLPKEVGQTFACSKIVLPDGDNLFVVSIYGDLSFSPFFTTFVGLITLVVNFLRINEGAEKIVLAGDFNCDRRMDDNPTTTKFSRRGERLTNLFFDSIVQLGFVESLAQKYPEFVQTHKNNRSAFPWQIDHIFVSKELEVEDVEVVQSSELSELSDHYPLLLTI